MATTAASEVFTRAGRDGRPVKVSIPGFDRGLDAADLSAISRHVEWLKGERGAVSLDAVLPSGISVRVFRSGVFEVQA